MYRIHPDTGEVLVPYMFADGTYGAADPALGSKRHHVSSRIVAEDIAGLRKLFLKGFPIWMSVRGTRDRRLISKGIVDAEPPLEAQAISVVPTFVPAGRSVEVLAVSPPCVTFSKPENPLVSTRADVLPIMGQPNEIAAHYLQIIETMSPADVEREIEAPRKLLIGAHVHRTKKIEIAYAPFDHVNPAADIVIVGITPGSQQMREAIFEAQRAMAMGLGEADVLARAKVHASFAGPMRKNLVKLMDAVGLAEWLGVASAESLWGTDSHRVHFTSAIRYPTFVDGENYSRSPDMNDVPFLFNQARKWLKEEIALFPGAVIVPMGDMVSEALTRIGREAGVQEERILSGMPHASTAANGFIARFLGGRGEDDEWRRRYRAICAKVEGFPSSRREAQGRMPTGVPATSEPSM